jgi:hypothetical protein
MKYKGFYHYRLKFDNPCEVAFAKAWDRQSESGHPEGIFIDFLIKDSTPRDKQVMATVIQWLGSNVGQAFLEDVIRHNPELTGRFGRGVK